jgi:hypothetical protein
VRAGLNVSHARYVIGLEITCGLDFSSSFYRPSTAAFDAIESLLGTKDLMPHLNAVFRDIGAGEFTILYPPGLREFRVV